MTSCECGWKSKQAVYNGKCKDYKVPGCWQGYDTWQSKKGKHICPEVKNWYWRRTGTSYNSTLDTGPEGHPNANSFSNVLFETTVPCYLWLSQAAKKGRGPKNCRFRCKGHGRLKGPTPRTSTTPGQATTSSSVAPQFQSYETVLAVRKAMAYFEPSNFKKRKKNKWKHPNCRY